MKCLVEIENYEISLKAQIRDDRVICENSTYTYAADVGLLNGQLKVIYSDINVLIDRTNFTLYKCHLLGAYLNRPDCSLCQRIDARFQCAFCSGTCRHRSRCTERPELSCPPPRIDFVHPLSGPALGGTRVTIEGSNLGQNFEEIASRVTIGNVPCKPIEDEYKPSNRIVCLTSPVVARFNHQPLLTHTNNAMGVPPGPLDTIGADIVVGNRAGYSLGPARFQFKTIYLRDHQPRYGPQSGGTRLVLTGANLDIGSQVQVFLDELPCLVEPNSVSSEQIVCRTSASRQPSRAIRRLQLVIDEAQIVRDDEVFYYTADPIVHKVSPLRAYLAGGRPINVLGANLTVVQAPRMAIYDLASGRKINESLCILQDDTRMQCPSPAVNLQLMDMEFGEQNIGSSYEPTTTTTTTTTTATSITSASSSLQQQPTGSRLQQQLQVLQQDESVRFRLSFVMDNALSVSYPQFQMEIAYTSDPRLYPFSSSQYKTSQEIDLATNPSSPGANQLSGASSQLADAQTYQIEADTYLLQPGEPTLVLYGENLRAAVSEYEITITVGQDLCNLTQLTHTRLVCVMPLDHMATPTDEDGHQTTRALPLVVVRIGFNLRYELGFVQYHPMLVEQIVAIIANMSAASLGSPLGTDQSNPKGSQLSGYSGSGLSGHPRLMHPAYPQYMPRESESVLHKVSAFVGGLLLVAGYAAAAIAGLTLVYSGLQWGQRMRRQANEEREQLKCVARIDALERSLRNECRVAALALQGDLNELERHVDLTGVPLLSPKLYVMKVFFPGMNQHPLLMRSGLHSAEQQQAGAGNLPMDYFEQLVLTKPFLLAFINTLERQPSFTIRDKVNVASLLMIALINRPDYTTDVMKTLLFQLVERSVDQLNNTSGANSADNALDDYADGYSACSTGRKLTRRASNLLSGLPISKRQARASHLSKVVGGSASSLMASTSVAAQMLLARMQKSSHLQQVNPSGDYEQHPNQQHYTGNISPLDCGRLADSSVEYMSTTTFNNRSTLVQKRPPMGRNSSSASSSSTSLSASASLSRRKRKANRHQAKRRSLRRHRNHQAALMLRRTESVVEKMLTNWLALNMYDHFHRGPASHSLYMLFEALKCQLERGPVDAVSGDAYYSLNVHKLLREPSASLQFEVVNLYVIVDADVLQSPMAVQPSDLLLDSAMLDIDQSNAGAPMSPIYDRAHTQTLPAGQRAAPYVSGNTITLALRVLDCDTISQVKAKILSALYRNSPSSLRLATTDVELSLRQPRPLGPVGGTQTLAAHQQQQQQHHHQRQCVTVVLNDDDFSSMTSFNGARRINTLRHYGITDQAIVVLKRAICPSSMTDKSVGANNGNKTNNAQNNNMIDDHYSNPYTEIQYSQCTSAIQSQSSRFARVSSQLQPGDKWHLTRAAQERTSAHLSEDSSSPASHSPSMMLLANNNQQHQHQQQQPQHNGARFVGVPTNQQQFYHPNSSSSTSSAGNALETISTSANSSSLAHAMVANGQCQDSVQQPIYCQIGSTQSQHGAYYCQTGQPIVQPTGTGLHQHQQQQQQHQQQQQQQYQYQQNSRSHNAEGDAYLARMLASKGTTQKYIENFFKTILTVRPSGGQLTSEHGPLEDAPFSTMLCDAEPALRTNVTTTQRRQLSTLTTRHTGACPPAIKWIFDLLDEAALRNGIADQSVVHAWKSNAFLLRFWVNFVKNPNYILDVDKSSTIDASLSVIAQTLMDSCATDDQQRTQDLSDDFNRLIFARELPKYREQVRLFYEDVASMRPVSDQEMVRQMSSLWASTDLASQFDTHLALKELCVYAINYGVEIMQTLQSDYSCQQLELGTKLEQCFRSFTIFEAYH